MSPFVVSFLSFCSCFVVSLPVPSCGCFASCCSCVVYFKSFLSIVVVVPQNKSCCWLFFHTFKMHLHEPQYLPLAGDVESLSDTRLNPPVTRDPHWRQTDEMLQQDVFSSSSSTEMQMLCCVLLFLKWSCTKLLLWFSAVTVWNVSAASVKVLGFKPLRSRSGAKTNVTRASMLITLISDQGCVSLLIYWMDSIHHWFI